MNKTALFALALFTAAATALYSDCKALPIYDVAGDFSTNSNPNGVWSYGYSATLGGSMTLHQETGVETGVLEFRRTDLYGGAPGVYKNVSGSTLVNQGVYVAPGQLFFHPGIGPTGEFDIIRFTSPEDDLYDVAGVFTGLDSMYGTSTYVHIQKNGSSIWNGDVEGFGATQSFNTTVQLNAGDRLDFVVGLGQRQSPLGDSTGVDATISVVPEPSALGLLLLTLPFSGRFSRRPKAS